MKLLSLTLAIVLSTFGVMANAAENAPVSVQSSIDKTLGFHHQLKSIQENRQASVHDVRRAEGGYYPRVDTTTTFGASYLNNRTNRANGNTQFQGTNSAEITATQTLWDGKATKYGVDMALLQVDSLTQRVLDNATTLSLDALIAHINVLLRRELVGYAIENVALHEHILKSQREREASGASTIADITQIQGRLVRAEAELSNHRLLLREQEIAYQRLTNTAPQELAPVDAPTTIYKNAEECFDIARITNPKILALVEDAKRSNVNIDLAKSAYHPVITAELTAGTSNTHGPGSNWTNYADALLVMRWNLYNGGSDEAIVRTSRSQYRQALEDLWGTYDDINQEVHNSWSEFVNAKEQMDFYAEAMNYNKQTADAFLEQFLIGQRSLLDVLDTSSELFSSSTEWAIYRTNRIISAYTLIALSGDFLNVFNIDREGLLEAPSVEVANANADESYFNMPSN